MEIKISVNNNNIMKHLTLEDVTLTYKKTNDITVCIIMFSSSIV